MSPCAYLALPCIHHVSIKCKLLLLIGVIIWTHIQHEALPHPSQKVIGCISIHHQKLSYHMETFTMSLHILVFNKSYWINCHITTYAIHIYNNQKYQRQSLCTWSQPSTNAVNTCYGLPVNHQPTHMATPVWHHQRITCLPITNQCTWAHPSTNAVNASNGLPVNHQPEYMGTPLNQCSQCRQWTTYQSLTSVHGHTPQPMQSMPTMDYLSITDQYTWAHPLSKDLSVNHHPVHMGTPSSRMYTWTYTLVLMVIIIAELHFMINHHSLHSP